MLAATCGWILRLGISERSIQPATRTCGQTSVAQLAVVCYWPLRVCFKSRQEARTIFGLLE